MPNQNNQGGGNRQQERGQGTGRQQQMGGDKQQNRGQSGGAGSTGSRSDRDR